MKRFVKCINNDKYTDLLTIGNIYEVHQMYGEDYSIYYEDVYETRRTALFYKYRFIEITRELKLKRITNGL